MAHSNWAPAVRSSGRALSASLVADTVLAWNKDHGGRAPSGHELGIVSRSRDHLDVRDAQVVCRLAAGRRGWCRRTSRASIRTTDAALTEHGAVLPSTAVEQALPRARQDRVVGMPEIDREKYPPGNGIGRAGRNIEPADRESQYVGRDRGRAIPQCLSKFRSRNEGIPAASERSRSRVGFVALAPRPRTGSVPGSR